VRPLLLVLTAAAVLGCRPAPHPDSERLAECFVQAAYECFAAEARQPPPPARRCCGKCNGTGRVLSGDRLALVPCECDPSCECKSGKGRCAEEGCEL
jgi:hypothetical protein